MTRRTQADRVMTGLRAGGLCTVETLGWEPPITRLAARIYELKQKGILIDTTHTCPEHGGAEHAYYRLTADRLF